MHPRVWFNPILPVFYPLESELLNEWIARLDSNIKRVVLGQLQYLNFAQRTPGGRVVNLYCIRYGLIHRQLTVLHDDWVPETILARIRFKAPNMKPYVVEFHAVSGRLFSITFDRKVSDIRRHKGVEIIEVDTNPPQPEQRDYVACAPSDYLTVLGEQGVETAYEPIVVFGPSVLERLDLADRQYIALAEIPDIGMLGVEQGDVERCVYLLYYDGTKPTRLTSSFRESLLKAKDIIKK